MENYGAKYGKSRVSANSGIFMNLQRFQKSQENKQIKNLIHKKISSLPHQKIVFGQFFSNFPQICQKKAFLQDYMK